MKDVLKQIFPNSTEENRAKYASPLRLAMIRYNIDNPNRIRAFLAQIGHESGQLSAVVENLNYSAKALRSVFGKYFKTDAEAEQYARKPEAIANVVYANRLGNGDTKSGDGWKYRGRGLIQITGKSNYNEASQKMYALPLGVDFVDEPELLATPEYAAQSAAWWWENAGLNAIADGLGGANDTEVFKQITKRVNGGYNGLDDRLAIYERAKTVIV
jgi:putative chitinase